MDELTYAADVDPLELRLRSDTDVDQAERGRAASAGMLSAGCLRGRLHLSGTKKGCDHGQSGARTVSADDERVVSCLTLAASIDGCEVRTIEGIGTGADLHPLEGAVVEHDGFQCGYRTPGQISSVLALLGECHPPRTQFRVSVGNMTGATRPYRMTARAASAAQTATAILDASWELFEENVIADITLADIAARSGVTTQTVLRRFGDKEAVFAAMFDKLGTEVLARRERAQPNMIDDIVNKLVDSYEATGQIELKMLAEEATTPAVRGILDAGRKYHRKWCMTMFSDALAGLPKSRRDRRLAQLVTICDLRTWEILRISSRLSRRATKLALTEMLAPLVQPA